MKHGIFAPIHRLIFLFLSIFVPMFQCFLFVEKLIHYVRLIKPSNYLLVFEVLQSLFEVYETNK